MKKNLAKILRRWADKLSPEQPIIFPPPLFERRANNIQRFQAARDIYSPITLREMERDPKFAAVVEIDTRRELLDGLALTLYQAGAITFRTEAAAGGTKRITASCHAVINPNTNQEPCQ